MKKSVMMHGKRYVTKAAAVLAMTAAVLSAGSMTAMAGEGENPYHSAQHLDVETFVEAGILDQETADKIAEAGSKKHEEIHARYAGKSEMTPEERHTLYANRPVDGHAGDSVEGLLDAGLITQDQADAMREYLAGNEA